MRYVRRALTAVMRRTFTPCPKSGIWVSRVKDANKKIEQVLLSGRNEKELMASYYKRKNGMYCVRVSNGLVGGRQQLVSATYRPMPGMSKAAMMNDLREFSKRFEKAVHDGVYMMVNTT